MKYGKPLSQFGGSKKGEGELIVCYRPTLDVPHTQYVRCKFCYGYYAKVSIWKHTCQLMPAKGDAKCVRKRVSDCVTTTTPTSASLATVLNGMPVDDVGQAATKDALILQLGQHLVTKFYGDKEQHNYIRCKMRFLGRLLLYLRKKSGQMTSSLSDFINPSKFVVPKEVAKDCIGFSDDHGLSNEP